MKAKIPILKTTEFQNGVYTHGFLKPFLSCIKLRHYISMCTTGLFFKIKFKCSAVMSKSIVLHITVVLTTLVEIQHNNKNRI